MNKQHARKKLFMIIGPHIRNWTAYGDIVDIVKRESPDMYQFGEGVCRYVAPVLRADLDLLELDFSWIKKTRHFRGERDAFCHTAYKISDLGRIILRNQEKEKQTARIGINLGGFVIISPETINSAMSSE